MKTALDFYARGKQKEANADEYDRSRYYSKDRFICPECGEPVHLTGSKYSNHFAHFKKSDVSAECDRRVDGSPTDSVYERIGLPIYMRINSSGDFYLYMGFKALPTALMEKAVAESVTVKIDRKNTYRINTERFSCERTALIPLDYIPLSGHKYHLCYEPVNKTYAISQHWSDYADGFSYEAMWIKSAAQTLSEAMVLAAGQLLDVEFNDLKGGYRLRYSPDKVCVDIFLFDSLSSGAGYSSMLAGRITDLMEETYKVLECKNHCATACHDCLKHYWNQRVQNLLDRHLAKQLLDWSKDKKMANPISYERQVTLIKGIKEMACLEDAGFNIIFDKEKIYGIKGGRKTEIYVHPAMWNVEDKLIPNGAIAISDKVIINSMPHAYALIRNSL